MAFRRRRNLVGLLVPQALFVIVATVAAPILATSLGPDIGIGAAALAVAPGLVRGDRVAEALASSRDAAAALCTGTLLVTLLAVEPALRRVAAVGGAGVGGAGVGGVALALGVGAALAATVPTVRDQLLVPLRWAETAFAVVLAGVAAYAALASGGISAPALAAAIALVLVGVAGSLLAMWIGGARGWPVLAGAGTRDPAIAAGFCLSVAAPAATAVPVAYGVVLLGAAAVAVAVSRRRPPGDVRT
jgi:hypothetical protein